MLISRHGNTKKNKDESRNRHTSWNRFNLGTEHIPWRGSGSGKTRLDPWYPPSQTRRRKQSRVGTRRFLLQPLPTRGPTWELQLWTIVSLSGRLYQAQETSANRRSGTSLEGGLSLKLDPLLLAHELGQVDSIHPQLIHINSERHTTRTSQQERDNDHGEKGEAEENWTFQTIRKSKRKAKRRKGEIAEEKRDENPKRTSRKMTTGVGVGGIGSSVRTIRQTVKGSVLVELGKMDITVQDGLKRRLPTWWATKHSLGPSYLSSLQR